MFLTQDKNDQKPNKPTTASLYDITPAQTKFMTKPVTSDRVVFHWKIVILVTTMLMKSCACENEEKHALNTTKMTVVVSMQCFQLWYIR